RTRRTCSGAATAAPIPARHRAAASVFRSCAGCATCTAGTCVWRPAARPTAWWLPSTSTQGRTRRDRLMDWPRRSARQPDAAEMLAQVEGGPAGPAIGMQLVELECDRSRGFGAASVVQHAPRPGRRTVHHRGDVKQRAGDDALKAFHDGVAAGSRDARPVVDAGEPVHVTPVDCRGDLPD